MALFWKSLEEAGGARADKHTKVSGRKHLSVGLSRINSSPWLPFRLDLFV